MQIGSALRAVAEFALPTSKLSSGGNALHKVRIAGENGASAMGMLTGAAGGAAYLVGKAPKDASVGVRTLFAAVGAVGGALPGGAFGKSAARL